jgi:predicted MFS family arabinose efflux permease
MTYTQNIATANTNNNTPAIWNFIAWLSTALFYAYQMTLRVLPSVLMLPIMQKFDMDAQQFGILASFYYFGYALSQIPVGIALDRFPPKLVITICLSLCSLGVLCLAITEIKAIAYLGRFLVGSGSVAGILGAVKTIDQLYPDKTSIMLGFTVLIGVTGAYYGGQPVHELLQYMSMEYTLYYIAAAGIALALVIIISYSTPGPDNSRGNESSSPDEKHELSTLNALVHILKDKRIWLSGLFGGLMVGPLEGFADVWGANYLRQIHGLDPARANSAIVLIFLGLGIGSPIIGSIIEKYKNYATLTALYGWGMIVTLLLLFSVNNLSYTAICALHFITGMLCAYQVILFGIAGKFAPNRLVALSTSVINMFIMIFGIFYHIIIGTVLGKWFEPVEAGNALSYSAGAYHSAFAVIIIGLLLGVFGFVWLRKSLSEAN